LKRNFETGKKPPTSNGRTICKEVAKNPLTGIWAKEVAESLLKEEH
jgi:hypothetical protein